MNKFKSGDMVSVKMFDSTHIDEIIYYVKYPHHDPSYYRIKLNNEEYIIDEDRIKSLIEDREDKFKILLNV